MKRLKFLFTAFLLFVAVGISAQEFPTVSTDGNVRWYAIRFVSGVKCITANGTGEVTTAGLTGDDAQLWKITGNETDGYTFTNKNGFILYVNAAGKNELVKAGTEEVVLSRFAITGENGYLEIRPKENNSLAMNFWEGTGVKVGLWNCNDANNFVEFVEVFSSGDYVFTLTDGVNVLLGYTGSEADIVLPADFNGNSYVIGSRAFSGCSGLTSVTIGNSVTSIGSYAFDGCSGLTSIEIPNSVTSIGDNAFSGCNNLRTVVNYSSLTVTKGSTSNGYVGCYAEKVINVPNGSLEGDFVFGKPNGVNTLVAYLGNETEIILPENYNGENYVIGAEAFKNNTSITSLTIPNSVTSIGFEAFKGCSSLRTLDILGTPTLEQGAFSHTGLEEVVLPEGITEIPTWGFDNSPNLRSVTIPSSVTSIGNSAFEYCSGLASITIPNSVTSIGDYAFVVCSGLTSVTIGNSVTSIGDYAFCYCSGLTSIEIPNSVTSIGVEAFKECSSLSTLEILGTPTLQQAAFSRTGLEELVLPEGITEIPAWGFDNSPNLRSVTIPNSVTSIGSYAFDGCSGLTSVTIPNSVTSIGKYAFYNIKTLTSVTIGNSVTSIGSYAFNGCNNLKTVVNCSSLTVTKGSTSNGYVGCYAEKVINVPNGSLEGDFVFGKPNGVNTLVAYLGNETEIILPENYNGENYVIGAEVFKNNTSITSLTIPNSVTSIGYSAFNGCTSLKDLRIEDGEGTLSLGYNDYNSGTGKGLFYDCPLETLYLGRDLSYSASSSYGYSPFYNIKTLTSVTIGNNVTSIGDYAFLGCSGLTSITIPNSVTSIGNYAFNGCTSLKELRIEDGTETLSLGYNTYYYGGWEGKGLFYDCPLETLYLGRNLSYKTYSSYGYSPFYNIKTLTSVTIGNSVTSIGDYAFLGCSGLTSIEIPNSVTSIGSYAFEYCSGLTSIEIPNSVTSIGNSAFNGCTSLKELRFEDGTETLSLGYNYYSSSAVTGEGLFYDCPLETLYLGRDLSYSKGSSYGYSPFYNIKTLTSVTIGNSVTSIGDDAFYGCDALEKVEFNCTEILSWFSNKSSIKEIIIGNSVTSIGKQAFFGCSGLTSIEIPNNVTSIGDHAFYNCSGLKRFTIPNSVTRIGNNAFDGTEWYNNQQDGVVYANKVLYKYKGTMYYNTSITIESGTLVIADNAFSGCSGLTSIEIPNSVTSLGEYAFFGCSGLTSVTIPNSVTSIGGWAFSGCSGLTSVTIGNSVTSIGESAFSGCDAIENVELNCSSIGNWFSGKTSLKEVVIGNDVTEIGYEAFYNCQNLESLVISGNITSIGMGAFQNCKALTTIRSLISAENLFTPGDYAFEGVDKDVCILYVPQGAKETYATTAGWSDFANIEDGVDVFTITYMIDGEVYKEFTLEYGAEIPAVEAPVREGYTFSGWSEIPATMPAEDITIEGIYSVNSNTVTVSVAYMLDGEVYKEFTVEPGAAIPTVEEPEAREGHTFSGWKMFEIEATPIDIASNADEMLYSNAYCTNTTYGDQFTSWDVLFDGRDNTFFHSEYANNESNDGLDHYIRVDLGDGNETEYFSFTYTTRNTYSDVNSPTVIVVEGSNEADGAYSEIATIEDLPTTNSTVYNSTILENENKFRYIRFRVTETASNQSVYGHPYFFIAEFGMTQYVKKEIEVPEVMPEKDITIEGSFATNSYTVTYTLDGEVYATETVEYGAKIPAVDVPVREGYTFSGWSNVPATMPAKNVTIKGTFAVNSYTVTYVVDGEEYKSFTVKYGAKIPTVREPAAKKGYTFSGWSEIPATMPAEDITITGSFTVNSYTVTYIVDGDVYAIETLEYGAEIPAVEAPVREGYTFSGWSEIPATMPAENIIIEGIYIANSYTVTYIVDGDVYAIETVEYGAEIPAVDEPAKEGYTFSGWSEVPATMPAEDITVEGIFTVNYYTVTYIVDGEVYATDSIAYGGEVVLVEEPTKEGYTFSGWSKVPATMPAEDITVTGSFTQIETAIDQVLIDSGEVVIYDLNGLRIVDVHELKSGVYIINGKKILVK